MSEQIDDSMDYFAAYLDEMKTYGSKTTLILGSRASSLFYCAPFYSKMLQFGSPTFPRKKPIGQFRECYEILTARGEFTFKEVHQILRDDLRTMTVSTADLYLAALIMQGFFDVIISARLDDFLEQALLRLGMHSQEDYTVYNGYDQKSYAKPEGHPFALVNVFGLVETNKYRVKRQRYFEERPQLREYIRKAAYEPVLLLGYDPFWDAELGELFPESQNIFWCISEEEGISRYQALRKLEETREFRPYIHASGSYDRFVENLYWKCGGRVPVHYLTQNYIFNSQLALQQEIASLKAILASMTRNSPKV